MPDSDQRELCWYPTQCGGPLLEGLNLDDNRCPAMRNGVAMGKNCPLCGRTVNDINPVAGG